MPNALTPAQAQQAAMAQNAAARALIAKQSLPMLQPIYSATFNPATQNVFNIPLRYVGLVTGFLLEITGTVNNTDGAASLSLTTFNLANLLSQVQFNDLQNNVRINTTGWHLNAINSARAGRPFGSAATTDSPIAYGSNWNVIKATGFPIAHGATGTFSMYYWVPLAYDPARWDLRGAMFANVVNATANLQLTFNPNATAIIASGDGTLAVATGAAGNINPINLTVYQAFLDQLPIDNKTGQFILPGLDIGTIYELKNTTFTSMVAGNDFPFPYSNFRDFLSTCVIYDRGGTLSTGSDINYWSLQSANLTNIFKKSPYSVALSARQIIGDDFPSGLYYFDHRAKPLSTIQYGNLALNLNASNVTNAVAYVGWEDLSYQNAVTGAGSLPAN